MPKVMLETTRNGGSGFLQIGGNTWSYVEEGEATEFATVEDAESNAATFLPADRAYIVV